MGDTGEDRAEIEKRKRLVTTSLQELADEALQKDDLPFVCFVQHFQNDFDVFFLLHKTLPANDCSIFIILLRHVSDL